PTLTAPADAHGPTAVPARARASAGQSEPAGLLVVFGLVALEALAHAAARAAQGGPQPVGAHRAGELVEPGPSELAQVALEHQRARQHEQEPGERQQVRR